MHVLITGDTEEEVDRAAAMVQTLLKPVDDDYNEHKRAQLRELALINGTLRNPGGVGATAAGVALAELDKTGAGYRAPAELVTCKICGDGGHPTSDCPFKNDLAAAAGAQAAHLQYQRFSASWASATRGFGPSTGPRRGRRRRRGARQERINPCKLFVGRWRITSPTRCSAGSLNASGGAARAGCAAAGGSARVRLSSLKQRIRAAAAALHRTLSRVRRSW